MPVDRRIRTPWALRWSRFRHERLPALAFLALVPFTLWMWNRQGRMPNAIGEVSATRIDVASGTDGILLPVSSQPWSLFDRVSEGQLVALLDDRRARASLNTLRQDLVRLQREVDAEAARLRLEDTLLEQSHLREKTRLRWKLLQNQLDVLDRQIAVETDRVDLLRQNTLLDNFIERLDEDGTIPPYDVTNMRMQRDVVARRIEESEAALAEALQQRAAASKRLAAFQHTPQAEQEDILAPLSAAVATQAARMEEMKLQIESLAIRAPISGVIAAIYLRPGQAIQAGDSVLCIASDQSQYIVTYIRQEQRLRPKANDDLVVRLAGNPGHSLSSHVEIVGPQVELVPTHHLRDPAVPEWGLPIRIALPDDPTAHLRPGELVDLTFRRNGT